MTVLTSPPPVQNPLPAHEPMGQDVWDDLGKTGIVYDFTGNSWEVTASGTNTSVTVGTVGHVAEVRGFRARISATEVVTLGAPLPPDGQSRFVRVVLRLDRADFTCAVRTVVGASATSPALPAPFRSETLWDLPLATVRQYGPAGIITNADITDTREWAAEHQFLADDAELHGPVGCTRTRAGVRWERQLVNGVPTWVDLAGGQRAWRARRAASDFLPSPAEGEVAGVQVPTVAGATYAVAGTVIHSAATRNGLSVRCKAAGSVLESYPTTSLTEKTSDPVFGDFVGTGATVAVQVTAQRDGGSAPITVHDGSHVRVWRVN